MNISRSRGLLPGAPLCAALAAIGVCGGAFAVKAPHVHVPADLPDPVSVKWTSKMPRTWRKADVEITILTVKGMLAYATREFAVPPGAKVKLTLKNVDAMQHNLVLCTPGKKVADEVGMAALQLGDKALEMHYVPQSYKVLWHTRLVGLGKSDSIYFVAPRRKGEYPYVCTFPGHYTLMRGVMWVGKMPVRKAGLSGLQYSYYEGSWDRLPDFSKLTPKKSGALKRNLVDIGPRGRGDNFAFVYSGTLNAPKKGKYTFMLNSDDGSRLYIDGRRVVDNDGVHGTGDGRKGNVTLSKGGHDFKVEFFEKGGGEVLQVAWSGPGMKLKNLSAQRYTGSGGKGGGGLPYQEEPYVHRTQIFGASGPKMIAVGMPAGVHYAFDSDTCAVSMAWTGDFLDARKNWSGRGGDPSRALGSNFFNTKSGCPLRIGSASKKPLVKFKGYELTDGYPDFLYEVDGAKVRHRVRAGEGNEGLVHSFDISGVRSSVYFVADQSASDKFTSPQGTFRSGRLKVSGRGSVRFEVRQKP